MKIVKNKVTDYLSINVTEDETLWDEDNLYQYADEIRYGHFIYKYAGEGDTNTTDDPETTWNRDKNVYSVWVQIRPTNYWAALDDKTVTQTEVEDELIIEISNIDNDTIALLNVLAQSVTIQLLSLDGETELFSSFYNLSNTEDIVDEKSFWYNAFDFVTKVYEPNITILPNTKIKITLTSTGGTVKLGRLVAGQSIYVGDTLYPAVLDQITFSRFNTDVFGNTELVQGQTIKNQQYNVIAPTSRIPFLERKRKELTAVPVLFIMDDSATSILENLLIYGYFTSAPFSVTNATKTNINISIKGLI